MPAIWNHQFAEVNGLRLHYVREGGGKPVVLLHGWPGFWYEWNRNIRPLAEHFDVIVPDMRGFAYSAKPDVPPEEGYTDIHMADDIATLIGLLGFDKVHVVGNDFGAAWAQRFARKHPDKLDKLMLFDPPYVGIGGRWFEMPQPFNSWYMFFHQLPWAEDLVGATRASTELYLRHFLRHWSHDTDVFNDDDIAEWVEAYSQPGALRGGFNCYRAVFRAAGIGDSSPISAPTRVLWGDSDPILPFAWSDKLGETFTNFTLKKMEGLGHFMHAEAPERVNKEIVEFLELVDSLRWQLKPECAEDQPRRGAVLIDVERDGS